MLAHVQMLDHVLREADQFNANLVTIAEQVRERVARLFESTEDKPHSLEAMSIAIDGFCVRLSFRPAPKRLFEKWTVKKIRERIKK